MSKHKISRIILLTSVAALSVSLAACGTTGSADQGADNGEFSGLVPVYTPRQGGSAYVLGGGIANEISKTIDGVQGTVEATTGTQEMLQRLTQAQEGGDPAFALPETAGTLRAVEGIEPFEEPHPDIRALTSVQIADMYLVTRSDSGMDSVEDLEGKSVGLGVAGSVVNYLTKEVLEAHGVEEGSYDERPLGYQEVADGLANGSLDAGVIAGAAPVSKLTELAAQHDVTVLATDDDVMAELTEEAPYILDETVKPGMYQGMDEEVDTFGFSVALVTHADTPDELVTDMMELVFERTDALAQVHASAKNISLDMATTGIGFEFHPAAAEYLEENGVEIP